MDKDRPTFKAQAVGYLRVSTKQQENDGASLEAQAERVNHYCAMSGVTLLATFQEAQSGKSADNRAELQKALKLCDQGHHLVIYSLSRMARSTLDAILIDERIRKAGGRIVSLSEHIDTGTASGRLMYRILASFSEYEREIIVERTDNVIQMKKRKRERTGSIPFGYRLGEDGKSLESDDTEQQALELMRQYQAQGLTNKGISEALAAAGIVSRKGTPFDPSSIWYVLKRAA